MKVVVTGASGLIGTALVSALNGDGHDVHRLVRRAPKAADEARWDPSGGTVDDAVMAEADAVVHLAGAGIGDKRWTDSHKRELVSSRIDGTTTIAKAVAANAGRTKVLLSASAVGWYGNRGDDLLDESAGNGDGFLADLVRQWEAATSPASAAGVRVAHLRTGIVLSPSGGALGTMLPIFKLGAGGRLGSGRQWMPWIALADEIAAIRFALATDSVSGPLNLSAPNPVTNREFTKALGRALNRPALAAVPALALRVALGEMADEALLVSQRAIPKALVDAGFEFSYPLLDEALASMF